MKPNRILMGFAGFLVFLSIALTFVWILPSKNSSNGKELTFENAISKIRDKEVTEVLIKHDSFELTDKNEEKFFTKLYASDATRERLLSTIDSINIEKPGSIKTNLEQSRSGWGWSALLNASPVLLFYAFWAATLAVIVYAVRTLSRNKS